MWSYLEKGSLQMQLMKMRLSGSEQAWNSMTDILIRRPYEHIQVDICTEEDSHMKTEAGTGVMQPQHKEHQDCWQLPKTGQTFGAFFSSEHGLLSPWLLTSSLLNYGRINYHLVYLICYHSPRKQIPSASKDMEQ